MGRGKGDEAMGKVEGIYCVEAFGHLACGTKDIMAKMKPQGILHFTIGVTDIDRATEFYTEFLGCRLVRRNRRGNMSFLASGDDYFVLASTGNHVPPNLPGETAFHHAFILEPGDYDRAVQLLEDKGIETSVPAVAEHTTFPGRHLYFYDPDGNGVEITDCTGLAPGL